MSNTFLVRRYDTGGFQLEDPFSIVSAVPLPALDSTPGIVGCRITRSDATTLDIVGSAADILRALAAAILGGAGGTYVPNVTSSGAGVIALNGVSGKYQRQGNIVFVSLNLNFTPAVNGVAETLTVPLPTADDAKLRGTTGLFTAVSKATGVAEMTGIVPATDGAAQPAADVGAATVSTSVLANALRNITIFFTYNVQDN